MNYISVFTAHGPIEAESIRAFLESNGINAILANPESGLTFSFTIGYLDKTDVLVPEEEEQKARQILEDMQEGLYELDDDDLSSNDNLTDQTASES